MQRLIERVLDHHVERLVVAAERGSKALVRIAAALEAHPNERALRQLADELFPQPNAATESDS